MSRLLTCCHSLGHFNLPHIVAFSGDVKHVFCQEIKKIVFELSSIPTLIWSSEKLNLVNASSLLNQRDNLK